IECTKPLPRRKVKELIRESRNGRSIAQAERDPNGHVLTLSAVRDVYLDYSECKPIRLPNEVAEQFSISEGAVFVSRSNTRDLVGLAAVAPKDPPTCLIYPALLIRLDVDQAKVLPEYL